MVIGLDCAGPQLVFEEFRQELPTLSQLMAGGTWGTLESSVPCITVPAWASMLSSRDPGVLGVYGFRNRADTSYDAMTVANASSVRVKRVWDVLSEAGKESIVLNVPQTYPVRPLKGHMVGGFLTPGIESAFAYPAIFKQEVLKVAPDYPFDVKGFRTHDKAALLQRLIDLSDVQYTVMRHAMTQKPWDFLMHVNIGVDRLHHGFWRFHDPQHRAHDPSSPFRHAIRDYYKMVDAYISELLRLAGDETAVLVVSDHGVKRMDGGICLNEWLWRNGWLHFKTPPPEGQITRFEDCEVDWSKTRAWGAGGYYGRVFLNIAGREPQGVIPPDSVAEVRAELAAALAAISDHHGQPLNTRVILPEEVYSEVNGVAPDMMVYFGDLHWRSVGSLGHGAHFTLENDTGPDDANHATHGLYMYHDPAASGRGRVDGPQLMDIAPTILHHLGVPVPQAMQGRRIDTQG
ncbi:MAG: alkaline phosphatase family protein [Anaerolineae bacterium]